MPAANGEINLLSNKNAELQRDLELERRKVRDLQEAAREQDKEYQKLKVVLAPSLVKRTNLNSAGTTR
jgi:E3 ubiquitin-protein ligase CCNP1IP1